MAAEKKTSATTDSGATPPNEPMALDDLEMDTGLEGPMSVMMIEQSWTQPYITYLLSKRLPDDPTDTRHITRRSKAFAVINGKLYKYSITGVLQRCVPIADGRAVLLDIHEGTCGHHAGSLALVAKALRAGFYWPTAMRDAKDIVEKCNACQRITNKPRAPALELWHIPLAWPFT